MSKKTSGFIYIWYDRKHKRFYVGSHWGSPDDGYVCSSSWMKRAYQIRPQDFKRRIIKTINTTRKDLLVEEERWLSMIKDHEIKTKYYNLVKFAGNHWHGDSSKRKTVGEKITLANTGRKQSPEEIANRTKSLHKAFAKRRPDMAPIIEALKQGELLPSVAKQFNTNPRMIRICLDEVGIRSVKELTKKDPPIKIPRGAALKEKWADPIWKENQIKRLSEGAKHRPPRSEESKLKASIAQKGKPKIRKSTVT